MLILAAGSSEGVASWPEIAAVALFTSAGFVGHLRWLRGWGRDVEGLAELGSWARFLTRYGFAILPMTFGALSMTLALVFFRLFSTTDIGLFAVLGLMSAIGMFCGFIWGLKEWRRPSKWRRWPAWWDEYEQRTKIRGEERPRAH